MTAPIVLREYQEAGIAGLRGIFQQRKRRALLVMPTGAGKTATAAEMVARNNAKGKRILWLVDRGELVEQAGEAFERAGVSHSYILPGEEPLTSGRAHVGTIQSFLARRRRKAWTPEQVDLIIIDEAHRTESGSYQAMLDCFPNAYVVGLTATPVRGDGRGLGNTFEDMVTPITTRELMEEGYLVRPRYFVPGELNLDSVQGKRGAYTPADYDQMEQDNPQLIGDIIETFTAKCPERRAVVFPMTIRQSIAIRDAFNEVGISAIHIDGGTPKGERKALMDGFRSGEYQILTSVNIAIEGLDVPDVSCVVMARPTKSERIWIQAVGRGLRTAPGKSDCIVLDHAGLALDFGPAEDFAEWELHAKKGSAMGGGKKRKQEKRDPAEVTCDACGVIFYGAHICPECGYEHETERGPQYPDCAEGDLEELTAEGRVKAKETQEIKKQWWAGLQGYAQNKGYSPGWAYHKYKEKFGTGPGSWQKQVPATDPAPEVLGWIKAKAIAFAKAREKERERGAA